MMLGCLYGSVATAQFVVCKRPEVVQIDRREVSNKEWAAFLQFTRNDPALSRKYSQSMKPSQWSSNKLSLNRQHEPITGISWQQALAYCDWRSITATYLATHAKPATYQQMKQANARAKTRITYRLPTDEEFKRLPIPPTTDTRAGISFRCVRSVKKTA